MSPKPPSKVTNSNTVEMANISGPKSPLAQLENISKTSTSIINEITPLARNSTNVNLSNKKHSNFVYQDLLGDVVAYVEVRSEMEDLSLLFGEHLLFLGATVSRTFNKKVTHVVFKRGRESTFKKAAERNVPVVSVVWVDQCKKLNRHVPEEPYVIKEYKTYGKRLKLLYNLKHTQIIEDNEKSFKETKQIVESIRKSQEQNREVVLAPKTPVQDEDESVSPVDYPSPITTLQMKFTLRGKSEILSKTPKESKTKLFITCKKLFLENPTSESTPLTNKKQKSRSPLTEPNSKKFKSYKEDGKENEELALNTTDIAPQNIEIKLEQKCDPLLNRRRSLDNFEITKSHQSFFQNKPKINNEIKTIVFTSFTESMIKTATAIVECLGGYRIENNVTENTTHVICGEYKRTLNLLYGLMRGCFILDGEFLMSSFENGNWLDERYFELIEYFPSALVRQPDISGIFNLEGKTFFISPNSSPPAQDLANLINLGGGVVATCYRRCNVIVGSFKNHNSDKNPDFICVDEKSILDCISGFKKFKV